LASSYYDVAGIKKVYPRREGRYVVVDYKYEDQAVQQLSVIIGS